jgi:hypothetical protein
MINAVNFVIDVEVAQKKKITFLIQVGFTQATRLAMRAGIFRGSSVSFDCPAWIPNAGLGK